MAREKCLVIFVFIVISQLVLSTPLTVVSDKSGEQQVKEALRKAEQEAEKAAKEGKTTEKPKDQGTKESNIQGHKNEMLEGINNDRDEQANKRMKAMAAKLNNLVMKFQRKVMANKLHRALERRVALANVGKKRGQASKSSSVSQKNSALDLSGLDPLSSPNNPMATAYKEDTRLEDRLALEAEEEKKVKDGETYDEDAGYGDSMKNYAGTTSLSPKEQASQEMQQYSALISSESSRELSQIQDEISKATQSSMGKVSVQGENLNAPLESTSPAKGLDLGGLGSLGGSSFAGFGNNLGGLGSLDSGAALGSQSLSPQSLTGDSGLPGLNLGGQSDAASVLGGSSQDQSLAGAIDINPMSGSQNAEQLPGLLGGGAGLQGASQDAGQSLGGMPVQGTFSKKSKITKQKAKASKSKRRNTHKARKGRKN
ncbi:uncharacterized protein LOC135682340 isoform X2 [Rhopilema esculentum]|uniref:uncharacterized protein LOC135682340 isoform X2 n=1 Tax=Rhopilema esculentum TaxID=499914 RepID=UPI0031D4E248